MRRITEGVLLGFTTCWVLTLAAVIAAFVLHYVEIPLLLTARAALPQGLPEVELTGDPLGFVLILVLVAAAYAAVARRRSRLQSVASVLPEA